MSLQITKIEIRNFRSIRNLTLKPSPLTVLVGKNDCGKSNVLRALNLFFESKTDDSVDLDFGTDHNVFNQPKKTCETDFNQAGDRSSQELPLDERRLHRMGKAMAGKWTSS